MQNLFRRRSRWQRKQDLAGPGRYYGDGGTIHSSGDLDVEVCAGQVVAVWFRCQRLPIRITTVSAARAREMSASGSGVRLSGVEVIDL